MTFQKLLVVCIGNICRSPMVEYLLKREFPALEVSSAGIHAMVGYPADDKAIHSMMQQHICTDISSHIAKQLNESMLKQADLVLVMTASQQQFIEKLGRLVKVKYSALDTGEIKIFLILIKKTKTFLTQPVA
jgi:protein-tyrosine phosphatase